MTGFLTKVRGSSLRNEAQIAGTISERSRIASGLTWRRTSSVGGVPKVGEMSVIARVPRKLRWSRGREELALVHRDLLDRRAERNGGEISEAAHNQDDTHQQANEQRPVGREGAGRRRQQLFLRERSGDGQQRDDEDETPDQHRKRNGQIVEHRVRRESGKSAAVVAGALGVGVKDLAKTVRPAIGDAGEALRQYGGQSGPAKDRQRQAQQR